VWFLPANIQRVINSGLKPSLQAFSARVTLNKHRITITKKTVFIQSIFLPKVPHKIKQPIFWSGLQGCADSLAIATAIKNESRLFVVLTLC
jgi:hypothetical protein